MPVNVGFGRHLAELLQRKGVSQRAAASQAGLSGTYVSNMVLGQLPTAHALNKLISAVDPNELLTWQDRLEDARVMSEIGDWFKKLEFSRISDQRKVELLEEFLEVFTSILSPAVLAIFYQQIRCKLSD